MDKFEHISIKGFRRLQDIELEMRDLIVDLNLLRVMVAFPKKENSSVLLKIS
jgi:hypothetical protein